MKKFKVTESQFKSVIKGMIKEDIQGQMSDYMNEEDVNEEDINELLDTEQTNTDIEEGLGDMGGGNGGHDDMGIGQHPSNLDQDRTDLMNEQINKMKKIINY